MTTPASSNSWGSDHARWQTYYQNTLALQAENLLKQICAKKKTPEQLRSHFDTILTIFTAGNTSSAPKIHSLLLQIVQTLHPLPLWWGKWSEWMSILEKSAVIAQGTTQVNTLLWIQLQQTEMLLTTGNAKKALDLANKILMTAQSNDLAAFIFRAELVIFKAQNYLGILTYQMDALTTLENSLRAKKEKFSKQEEKELEFEFILLKAELIRRQGQIKEAQKIISYASSQIANGFAENDPLLTKLHQAQSNLFWVRNEHKLAVAELEKSLQIFKNRGDHMSTISTIGSIGLIHWTAEEHKKSEKALQKSLALAEEHRLLVWQTTQTGNLALSHFSRGHLQQAKKLFERHLELSQQTGNYAEEQRARGNLGTVQIHLGDFESALENLQKDHAHVKERRLNSANPRLYAKIAWAYDGLGMKKKAIENGEKALELSDSPLTKLMALRCLSELDIPKNQRIQYAEEAVMLAKDHHRRLNHAGALITLSKLTHNDDLYKKAIELLEDLDASAWLQAPMVFKTLRVALLL